MVTDDDDDDDVFVGVAENAPTNGMQDNEVYRRRAAVATTTKRVSCRSGVVNLTPWLIISLSNLLQSTISINR